MGAGIFTITITDLATNAVVTLLDTPNVAKVTLKSTDRILVDMGFKEGVVPAEGPSFTGWTYTNIRLQLIPYRRRARGLGAAGVASIQRGGGRGQRRWLGGVD